MTLTDLELDLKNLGINKGDNLFITMDISSVGYFAGSKSQTLKNWQDILEKLVGDEGSFTLAAYTNGYLRFNLKRSNRKIFSRFRKTYAGSFSNYLIKQKDYLRSTHPTNSVIGYGKNLKNIYLRHNENSKSYSVLGDIAELPQSKFIMIGTVDKKNAPQSMHYAQEVLGITNKHPLRGLFAMDYIDQNGTHQKFVRKDIGGCSAGGYKLLGYLMLEGIVFSNKVGNAFSIIMPAKKAIDQTLKVLSIDKCIIKCDDKYCLDCNGSYQYNGLKIILFYMKMFPSLLSKAYRKLKC